MARVINTTTNPNDPLSTYALWDNGRIDSLGANAPLLILDGPQWFTTIPPPARALHITDWAGPSGYVLNCYGGFHAFGGAPALGVGADPTHITGVPYVGGIAGVQDASPPLYVDWSWEPNGTGQGYVLDMYGEFYNFGGATTCPRSGPRWTDPRAIRLEMQWAPVKRAMTLDFYGGRSQDFSIAGAGTGFQTDVYYDTSRDWARDLKVTDFGQVGSILPSGYLLLASGIVHAFGPNKPQASFGGPSVGNQGTQRALEIISAANPLILAQVGTLGQYVQYTSSTRPTVVVTDPTSPQVTTTRPPVAWTYSDPESDKQDEWNVVVWPETYVLSHDMTNPLLNRELAAFEFSGTETTTRGVPLTVDLQNSDYRAYVRVKDTSDLYSLWANRYWLQSVPLPATPTGILATVDEFHVNLALTTPAPDGGALVLFEYQDDPTSDVWTAVRGAENVPAAPTTFATDWDIPFGISRTYRARLFTDSPKVTGNPSPEVTQSVTPPLGQPLGFYVVTATWDSSLGGEFAVFDLSWTRPRSIGVFEPPGSQYPIVISDGGAKGRRGSMSVRTLSRDDYASLVALIEPAGVLLVRDQFGNAVYCVVGGDWSDPLLQVAPSGSEGTALSHVHEHQIPLIEVAKPRPVPVEVDAGSPAIIHEVSVEGSFVTAGTADLGSSSGAIGAAVFSGVAVLVRVQPVGASGASTTTGIAALRRTLAMAASGAATSSGTAA